MIGHYTGLANDTEAAARLDEITAGLGETSFAWYGPTTAGSAAYFRFTGPTLLIEYAPQGAGGGPGGVVAARAGRRAAVRPVRPRAGARAWRRWRWGDAAAGATISSATLDHIHGVYRDPTNEYGSKYAS